MNSLKFNSNWRQQLTDALYFWSLLQIMVIPLGILVCRCLSLTHFVTFPFMMIYPSVTLFCVCLLPHFSTHIVKVTYWIFNSTVFQYAFYFLLWIEKKQILYLNNFIVIAWFYVWVMVYFVFFSDSYNRLLFCVVFVSFVSMWWKVRFQYVSSDCYETESETSWETILEVVSFNVKRQMASDLSMKLGIDTSVFLPLKNRLSSHLSQTQFPFLIEKRERDLTAEGRSMRVKLAQSAKDSPKKRLKSFFVALTVYCLGGLGFSEHWRFVLEAKMRNHQITMEAQRQALEELKETAAKILREKTETHELALEQKKEIQRQLLETRIRVLGEKTETYEWDCEQRKEAYESLLEQKKETQRQLLEFYEHNREAHRQQLEDLFLDNTESKSDLIDKELALREKLLGLKKIELDLYNQFMDVLVNPLSLDDIN